MLFYFIIFCAAGFFIGAIIKNTRIAIAVIAAISLCWAFAFGPWALATFLELLLGYAVANSVKIPRKASENTSLSFKAEANPIVRVETEKGLPVERVDNGARTLSETTPKRQLLKSSLPENFILTEEFSDAFELLENSDGNIYIMGKAGTGKSTLLTYFRQKTKKNIVVLAPTGVAALNVAGATIHSFFRFPTRLLEPNDKDIKADHQRHELFKKLSMVIIDEISMVRADLLDAIDSSLRLNRHDNRPFGGVQMVFFGDVFQLPPVVTGKDLADYFEVNYGGPYFFNAKSFAASSFACIELSKIFRQKDDGFKDILNSIRENRLGEQELSLLNGRFYAEEKTDDSSVVLTLCTTNKISTEINDSRMAALPTKEFVYQAEIKGKFDQSAYPTEPNLALKTGAQVMMLKNDPMKRWVNGTLGVITDLTNSSVEVSIDNVTYSVDKASWEVIDYQYNKKDNKIEAIVTGSFTQYPLKPAWAITIHKSQGQTFDRVNIHLGSGAFAHGQTYVAISRCTSLNGITLKTKIRSRDVIVDPKVSMFASKYIKTMQYIVGNDAKDGEEKFEETSSVFNIKTKPIAKINTEKYPQSPVVNDGGKEFSSPTSKEKTYTNSIGMKFVLIPAGTFLCDAGNEENPIPNGLKVTVSRPFYLGIYPVTQKQWEAVMGSAPIDVSGRRRWQYENLTSLATAEDGWEAWKDAVGWANPSWFLGQDNPVDSVPWEDAQEFLNRLNAMEGHQHYRLPTNMEWELAARGGTHTKFFLGEDESLMGDYAWVPDNADDMTHPAGQKKPNPYGLYDIYGNVSEWVQDWRGELPKGEVRDYRGPASGEFHVSRGSRTLSAAEFVAINDLDPKFWYYLQGFRIAFSTEDIPEALSTQKLFLKPKLCLAAVQQNGFALEYVPESLKTWEVCFAAAKESQHALAFVQEELKTSDFCLAAVQRHGRALEFVPEKLKTPELYFNAVQSNGSALEFVPEVLITPEISLAAVQSNGYALKYIPTGLLTAEICSAAVQQCGRALEYMPEALKTAEVCLAAVKMDGTALEYVPESLKTWEVCFAAVKADGRSIEHVPEELMTPEICLAAIRQEGRALKFVPKQLRTPELCLAAVTSDQKSIYYNSSVLGYVPEELRTADICLAAVQENGLALMDVPWNLMTRELCLAAVLANGRALKHVPYIDDRQAFFWDPFNESEATITPEEFCLAAVKTAGWALEFVPENMMTSALCLAAVTSDGSLEYVPEMLKTVDICTAAVETHGWALKYVPEELKTIKLCMIAAKEHDWAIADDSALEYVPEALKTAEVCLAAVKVDGMALEYVPEALKTAEVCLAAVNANGLALEYVPLELMAPELCLVAAPSDSTPLRLEQVSEYAPSFFQEKELSKIIQEIEARKIKYLIHFTSSKNLESILMHGFIPIAELESVGIPYEFNDDKRLDARRDCTCFSIEYPNYFLLDSFRRRNLAHSPWCILQLNIRKLFEEHEGDMYYTALNSASNAAPTWCRSNLQNNPDILSTCKAFVDMFQEKNPDTRYNQQYTRTEKELKSYLPTNPQAEVLVKKKIPSIYIDKIYFNNQNDLNKFTSEMKNVIILEKFCFVCDNFYFSSRDTVNWENR